MELKTALPRLAALHQRGLLVPFLGAGMSRTTCPDWKGFVARLERAASLHKATPSQQTCDSRRSNSDEPSDVLVRRANAALRVLGRGRPSALVDAVRDALYPAERRQGIEIPAQTRALARVWWPLVLTTNYDDLFARAYQDAREEELHELKRSTAASSPSRGGAVARPPLADVYGRRHHWLDVLGRGTSDCQRVLSSLTSTTTSILWALHGYLPASGGSETFRHLAEQLVVGHEEYRRIAHASPHYRRAFAEVFRQRSFLFLGAGLADVYLLDLFAEVQELHGPSTHPHFAFVQKGMVEADFLRTRFNIISLEYDDPTHETVAEWLGRLAQHVDGGSAHPTSWSFTVGGTHSCPDRPGAASAIPGTLELVDGSLPDVVPPSECVIIGAAVRGEGLLDGKWIPVLGPVMEQFLKKGLDSTAYDQAADYRVKLAEGIAAHSLRPAARRLGDRDHLQRVLELPDAKRPDATNAAIVTAWSRNGERDLRAIGEAVHAALAWASAGPYSRVRMPLLATGNGRHFAARFALAEMIRAYAHWLEHAERPVALSLHILSRAATFELASGRLDVMELLTCEDLRFWVEVIDDATGSVEREPAFCQRAMPLGQVAEGLTGLRELDDWTFEIEPAPIIEREGERVMDRAGQTLDELGVLPGGTLRFRRSAGRSAPGHRAKGSRSSGARESRR